jgi:hypothetical protein
MLLPEPVCCYLNLYATILVSSIEVYALLPKLLEEELALR